MGVTVGMGVNVGAAVAVSLRVGTNVILGRGVIAGAGGVLTHAAAPKSNAINHNQRILFAIISHRRISKLGRSDLDYTNIDADLKR